MEKEFLINANQLLSCIKALKPFISTEDTRYYLNGIFFELEAKSDTLNMVATDGIKLCVLNVDVDRQELFDHGELKVIVPTAALDTMLVMLKGMGDMPIALRFNETETRMHVDTPDTKADFPLIEGDYPEYRKVIPKAKPEFIIGFGKAQAKEALKALATHSDPKDGLQWEMTDEKSPLVIRARNKLMVVMPMRVSLPGEPEFVNQDKDDKTKKKG